MTIDQECIQRGLEEGRDDKEREIVLKMNARGWMLMTLPTSTGIGKANILRHLAASNWRSLPDYLTLYGECQQGNPEQNR